MSASADFVEMRKEFLAKKPIDYSGNPSLGGKKLKRVAKSDAANVYCIRVEDVANGSVAMPFWHPHFAAQYYKDHSKFGPQFDLVLLLAQYRNSRVIRKVNVVLEANGLKLFPEPESFDLASIIERCKAHGVTPDHYLNEETDEDDVQQCTDGNEKAKKFNFAQSDKQMEAADSIKIITDLDLVDWFILIQRQNGPGRNQAAWAGGFVDDEDSFENGSVAVSDEKKKFEIAAKREDEEETSVNVEEVFEGVTFTVVKKNLNIVESRMWDPRARFAIHGSKNGASVIHYVFKSI